jgi:hypothetical protein
VGGFAVRKETSESAGPNDHHDWSEVVSIADRLLKCPVGCRGILLGSVNIWNPQVPMQVANNAAIMVMRFPSRTDCELLRQRNRSGRFRANEENIRTNKCFFFVLLTFIDQHQAQIVSCGVLFVDITEGGRQIEPTQEQTNRNCLAWP